jgi:hypothetical protein
MTPRKRLLARLKQLNLFRRRFAHRARRLIDLSPLAQNGHFHLTLTCFGPFFLLWRAALLAKAYQDSPCALYRPSDSFFFESSRK